MEETILTVEQVAQILQVHPFTVLKFIKQGKLKAAKLGRVYRIRRTEVDRFLDAQMGGESTPRPQKPKKSVKKRDSAPAVKEVPGDSSLTDESKGEAIRKEPVKKDNPAEGFEKVQIIEEVKPENARIKGGEKKEDHYIIDFTY